MKSRLVRPGAAVVCGVLLASCGPQGNGAEAPVADEHAPLSAEDIASGAAAAGAAGHADDAGDADGAVPEKQSRSILRQDLGAPPPAPPVIEPVHAVIGFGASAFALDEAARAALDALLDAPATAGGGAIVLRGHSDSRGSDGDNLVASRRRAELVRDYLVGKGVAPERITLYALGEARPIAPNAMPDGSDDPEGRASNRRVEVDVEVADSGAAPGAGAESAAGRGKAVE